MHMKVNNMDINFKIIYAQPIDSIPILNNKVNSTGNSQEYSKLEIENPELFFPKTYLELFGERQHLMGRYASENGSRDDYFFSIFNNKVQTKTIDPEIIDLSLSKSGHLWKLTRKYISYSETVNSSAIWFPLTGIKIAGADDDAAWIVGLENAWYLNKNTRELRMFEWQGGNNSIVAGGSLCSLNKTKDKIIILNTSGNVSTKTVKANHGPFEQLAAFNNNKYITLQGTTFRIYDFDNLLFEIPLQSIGILDSGEPFISYTKNNTTIFISRLVTKQFNLPNDYSNYILPVIGIKDGVYLGYHLDSFGEFSEEGGNLKSLTKIDSMQYKDLIYPFRWKLGQSRFYSITDNNNILVSITGPKGVVLLEITINL